MAIAAPLHATLMPGALTRQRQALSVLFLFGVLLDLTGVRSSAFMLLYGVVWVSLVWMYFTEVRRTHVTGRLAFAGTPS
jgi:nitrate/nitrite transporter NarK